MESKKQIINYDQPINKLFNNYALGAVSYSPTKITKTYVDFIVPKKFDIITDCHLVFSNDRPAGISIITIIIDPLTIDKFRTDQNEICMKLRESRDIPSNVISLKSFFNKYAENFMPLISLMLTNFKIRVENPNIVASEIELLVSHAFISTDKRKNLTIQCAERVIEQHGFQVHHLNHEWIQYRETYNILRTIQKCKVFWSEDMVNHIMSFIGPIKMTPSCIVKETIKIKLQCSGLLKELYWFAKCGDTIVKIFGQQRLIINGHERQRGDAAYFERIVPYMHYNYYVPNVSIYSFVSCPMNFDNFDNSEYLNLPKNDTMELELELKYFSSNKYDIVICWTNKKRIIYHNGYATLRDF